MCSHGKQAVLREQLLQWAQNTGADEGPDFLEGLHDALSAAKGYGDGRVALHFHLWIRSRGTQLDDDQLCASFCNLPATHLNAKGSARIAVADVACREALQRVDGGIARQQEAVLIRVPESLKNQQEAAIATVIRLRPLDACDCLRAGAEERTGMVGAAARPGGESPFGLVATDRIAGFPPRLALKPDELPTKVVERGTQIVDDFAHDDAPSQGWLLKVLQPEDIAAALTVETAGDRITLHIDEAADFIVKGFQVMVGPVQLLSDTC